MRNLGRAWFTLACLALVVLAVPGFVLFGLHVAGRDAEVNEWLESNWRLSFSPALPIWAASLLLAVPPVLILLYFLKLKRKPLQVPSTFLWKKSVEDLHVNSLFQWLRRNVLLFLQILAVLGLIYGVLAPKFFARGGEGRRYVILVDNSASMGATDVDGGRLEQAKQQAIAEVDAAGDSDAGMVIAFSAAAEIRQSFTTNKIAIKESIRGIRPTYRPTRIEEALALAESLANPTRSTEDVAVRPDNATRTYVPTEGTATDVHLFSDGRFPDAPNFAQGNLKIQYHAIGVAGPNVDNVGIVGFSATRDEYDPARLFVNCRVMNFRAKPTDAKVELQISAGGGLQRAYDRTATLAARLIEPRPAGSELPGKDVPGVADLNFEIPEVDDRREVLLRVKLVGHRDTLPADDEAFLVVGVVRRASVLIAGPPNPILDAFFSDPATQAVCTVKRIGKDDLGSRAKYLDPTQRGEFDFVIFDRCAPARDDEMPQGNTLLIGRPPPPWKMPGEPQPEGKAVEKVPQPAIKGWVHQHGLLRYLSGLHEVGVFESIRVNGLPPRTPKLMESDRDHLLMFTLSRGPFVDAVLAFPLLNDAGEWNTNWPLLPSFPLFLRNTLYTLGNIRDAVSEDNATPGEIKSIRPGAGIDKITVTDPTGATTTLERGGRAEFMYSATDRPGVYSASWTGGGRQFAVNLLDPEESNLQPREAVTIGAEPIGAGVVDKRPREMWKWLILLALAVVMLEWYVYNKRVYV